MPISTTATSVSGVMLISVLGAPISLFWLPSVLMMRNADAMTAATISLVVVLPTLPVMPITLAGILLRYKAEISKSARRLLLTRSTRSAGV